MSDRVAFIRERLAEDEAVAREAAEAPRAYAAGAYGDDATEEFASIGVSEGSAREVGEHLERFSPARVLAEVESNRRILSLAETLSVSEGGDWTADQLLRSLLLPYRDHPDFDPTWSLEEE